MASFKSLLSHNDLHGKMCSNECVDNIVAVEGIHKLEFLHCVDLLWFRLNRLTLMRI